MKDIGSPVLTLGSPINWIPHNFKNFDPSDLADTKNPETINHHAQTYILNGQGSNQERGVCHTFYRVCRKLTL